MPLTIGNVLKSKKTQTFGIDPVALARSMGLDPVQCGLEKTMTQTPVRPISTIAEEIRRDWKNVNYAAEPYLEAMMSLNSITDRFYMDDAKDIILRFLCNAGSWRGETAKRIKAELKSLK